MTHPTPRHAISWIAIVLLSSLYAAEPKPVKPVPTVERMPIPSEAKAVESENLIKEVLKEEYQKRTAPERIALAKRLIQVAGESKADLNLYYASLCEARDVAVSSGEIDVAFNACELLAQTFVMEEKELKSAVLLSLARTAVTGEPALKFAQAGRELVDAYVAESQFDAAVKLLSPIEDLTRRSNDPDTIKSLQNRAKEIRAQQSEWARIKPYFDKLKENPADAKAALAVGKYHIASGDWEKAVPVLTKCASPALQLAAEKDLSSPAKPDAKADTGDLWWTASEKETGALKAALQQRAAAWYNQALEQISGLQRVQIEKRLKIASDVAGGSGDWLKKAGLVFLVNPSNDPTGKAHELISSASATQVGAVPTINSMGLKALKFENSYVSYPVSEAVRAIKGSGSIFIWIKHENNITSYMAPIMRGTAPGQKVEQGYTDFAMFLHKDKVMLWFNWPENTWPGTDGKTAFFSKRALVPGKWTMCGASWDGNTIAIYIDGERDNTYKSTATPLLRNGPEEIVLGCDTAGSPEYYNGLMSRAMIFNRALTDPEVKQLHLMFIQHGK